MMKNRTKKRLKNKPMRMRSRSAVHQGDLGRQLTRANSTDNSSRIVLSFRGQAAQRVFEDLVAQRDGR